MAGFRRATEEVVHVFEVDGRYLFKQYFDDEAVFARLREFYDQQHYRFDVPPQRFDDVRDVLGEHGYGLVEVDPLDEFVVVVRQYTAHPDDIFKSAVCQRRKDRFNFFVLTDLDAVERATAGGATRLAETDLEHPF